MKTIIHLDTESTGLEITKDRIIQLSLIKTDLEFNIIEKKKLLLSNCGVHIQLDAFKTHGISEDSLFGLPSFADYAHKVFSYLDEADYIAGYNIKVFDIPLLYEEFSRCGLVWEPKPIIDSCIIFKKRESRTLAAALKFYCGLEFGEGQAHDAENDVLASIEVLKGQIERYDFNEIETEYGGTRDCTEDEIQLNLISESRYENEDKRLSWDGKIILLEDGSAGWNFGKFKGKKLDEADLGYINWFLTSDFQSQTKNILKSLLNK